MADLVLSLPQPRTYPPARWLALGAISALSVGMVYVVAGSTIALLALLVMALYLRTESLAIPIGAVGYLVGLHVALQINSKLPSYDALLWRLDGCLGFQPSAWAMGVLANSPILKLAASAAYETLPVVLLLAALVDSEPAKLLRKAGLAGFMGFLLYAVLPAAGPLWYLNGQTEGAPKNAIPSLHMTWALIIRKALGGRGLAVRSCADAFVVFTVLSTLNGEHFMIDLIAAVPFTMLIEYLCSAQTVKRAPEAQPGRG